MTSKYQAAIEELNERAAMAAGYARRIDERLCFRGRGREDYARRLGRDSFRLAVLRAANGMGLAARVLRGLDDRGQ